MAWPSTVSTTYLDSDSDSVLSARSNILDTATAVNDIIASRAAASGIASLDSGGRIPTAQLPTTYSTATGDLNLSPGSTRVAVNNILNLEPRTVTQLEAIATPVEGDVAYCSNGDGGSACLAVYDGSSWLRVALGSAIASS